MKGYRSGLVIVFPIAIAMAASPAGTRERGPLLAPWGDPGIRFTPDQQRGPWARRWVGGKGAVRMMLTIYRSPDDAERVANLARGLGESPADDDDAAFLHTLLPNRWPVRGRAPQTIAYSAIARGLCVDFYIGRKRTVRYSLCSASRPNSAAVATVLTPKGEDGATMAALLLARYAARHPVRVAEPD